MRIAFLADPLDLQSAGIHTYARELLKAIDDIYPRPKDTKIYVVRPKKSQDYKHLKEIIIPVNRAIPLHQRIRAYTSIPKKLNSLNLDAVIEMAHFGPFSLDRKIKRLTMIHDLTPILFPDMHPSSSVFFHRLLLKGILKKADHVITNSESSKSDIIKRYSFCANKTSAVALGVNSIERDIKDQDILTKYGIVMPYFLHVGTIEPRKNLVQLIDAFNHLKKDSNSDAQLVLAGKNGWKHTSILSAIDNSPYSEDIILTGYLPAEDLPSIYSYAQAFIYPSIYEGFGLPILEAMKYGLPVITSDNSSLTEVAGDTADYFKSTENLTELMSKALVLTKEERLIRKGKSLEHIKQFTWEKTAMETLLIIENTIKNIIK